MNSMNIQQRESGLLVATDKPPEPPKPRLDPRHDDVREALHGLAESLKNTREMKTIACFHLCESVPIETVAEELVEFWHCPDSYHATVLVQAIEKFTGEREA